MADTQRTVLAAGTADAAAVAATPNLRLIGFSAVETAGAAASFSIQEGTSTDLTKELMGVTLTANESTREFPPDGIPCPGGIWVDRITGTTRITIYYRIPDYGKDSGQAPGW